MRRYLLKTITHRSTLLWLSGSLVTFVIYAPLLVLDPTAFHFITIFELLGTQLVWSAILVTVNYQLFSGRWALQKWSSLGLNAIGVCANVVWAWWSGCSLEYAFISFGVLQSGALMAVGVAGRRAFVLNSVTYSLVFPLSCLWHLPALSLAGLLAIVAYVLIHWAGSLWLMQSSAFALKQSQTIRNLLRSSRKDKRTISEERKKSDRLLLNILPWSVADELKRDGSTEPVHFESATVMFTDFKGFTSIAETLSARELVSELDRCFSSFDEICEKHRLEKLKTIGDSFMCAGGLPNVNQSHAADCVLAALEMQHFMQRSKLEREAQGATYWEIRLGIHSGPLVAGVIGKRKFAYDVWGDTVNTAARMESSGAAGRVNISQETYQLVRDLFVCEHRGKIAAKNKGDVDMYFVHSIKSELSVDGKGRAPAESFFERLERRTTEAPPAAC